MKRKKSPSRGARRRKPVKIPAKNPTLKLAGLSTDIIGTGTGGTGTGSGGKAS